MQTSDLAFARRGRISERAKARLLTIATIVAIVLFMQAVTSLGMVSTFLLPSPGQIARSVPALFIQENLLNRIGITAAEVFVAAMVAIFAGASTGWMLYRHHNAWLAFNSWIAGLNAAPLILLYPLLMVVFGRGNQTVVALALISALPPIMIKTREAFAGVPRVLRDVAQSFNLTPRRQFWLIDLPAAGPTMMVGVRLGCFYALISTIGAEFLTGVGGVGALIPDLGERFQIAAMYGTIVFVIMTSAVLIALIRRIERWFRPS